MQTTTNTSLINSLDLAKLAKEVDINKLLAIAGEGIDIGKILTILDNSKSIDEFLSIVSQEVDISKLLPILGEGKNIGDLLSAFLSGNESPPVHGDKHGVDTFSFILPDETLKLVDGLLLNILPIETLAQIDQAIDVDRLFKITLPSEVINVIDEALVQHEAIDIDELLSVILPENALSSSHNNEPEDHHGNGNEHDTFSFIIPQETLKLIDEVLFKILPLETLAQIDQAIEVDRLFSFTLPITTFTTINEAIIENINEADIAKILATIFPEILSESVNGDTNNNTFSFILPDETLKLVDGLLLNILPIETLAQIDQAIDVDRLFKITLPSEVINVIDEALVQHEAIDIDELLSVILPENALSSSHNNEPEDHHGNGNEHDTFSFIIPQETLKLIDEVLFKILPLETLAQIDQAIEVDRLFSFTLPIETLDAVNEAIINNIEDIDIANILATIIPEAAMTSTVNETVLVGQSQPVAEIPLV